MTKYEKYAILIEYPSGIAHFKLANFSHRYNVLPIMKGLCLMSIAAKKKFVEIVKDETGLKEHEFKFKTLSEAGCEPEDFEAICETVEEELGVDLTGVADINDSILEIIKLF